MEQKRPVEQGTSRLTREQKAARKKERHRRMMVRTITTLVIFFILAGAVILVGTNILRKRRARAAKNAEREAQIAVEEAALAARREKIREADKLALSYDYDGAIALLQSLENYDRDSDLVNAIAGYTATKSTLEAKDVTKIPHIFYHSLIVDPGRAFDTTMWDPDTLAGVNAWMTTVDEFDKITQQMYDRGWVLVRMRDLVTQKTDENGNVTFEKNKSLLLPQDKQPFVLSIDDWSYYHSYDGKGYADKAVVDENGKVKCQYTDASGNVSVGDYDVVPRLNTFLEAHPDGAYKGARGLIAMTGYNGVFGYRTDVAYLTGERLQADQRAFLESHPDFNWENGHSGELLSPASARKLEKLLEKHQKMEDELDRMCSMQIENMETLEESPCKPEPSGESKDVITLMEENTISFNMLFHPFDSIQLNCFGEA